MIALFAPRAFALSYILNKSQILEHEELNGLLIWKVQLCGKVVVLCQTGYGKVAIGRAVEILRYKYPIKKCIQLGTAGSLEPSCLNIFDIIISKGSMYFDVDFRCLCYDPFTLPNAENTFFYSSDNLIRLSGEAAKCCGFKFKNGLIASGDQFLCDPKVINNLKKEICASALDLESGCIGETSYINNLEWISIKGISNIVSSCSGEEHLKNRSRASYISQLVTLRLLELM